MIRLFKVRLALFLIAFLAAMMMQGRAALAHDIGIVDLTVHELDDGQFTWRWDRATKPQRPEQSLTLNWPKACQEEKALLKCAHGLSGALSINGLGTDYSVVILRVFWHQGDETVHTLTRNDSQVQLLGGPHDARDMKTVGLTYFKLGIEHILTGLDHVSFVISLLLLVGYQRRLIWTISAFTLAHSLTFVSSSMGWLVLRSAPVEITIALSIMLVASEALKEKRTLTSAWPAPVAFAFGLFHGLGFAGALKEIGLPEVHLSTALVTFNLGFEAGQLFILGASWMIGMMLGPVTKRIKFRLPVLYVIGALASYWTIMRLLLLAH